ncbi:protein-export chaperone SecB [Pediococcus acidilactici]|uniref:protein-export chaperone SecB n=1 Tax=Pediococcus acidilactici TaxID=1254 RepID=UPI00237F94AD|nr:protein-export chaperone SecB [Pediococcus acidilactici]WDV24851.1 protein-export chaperone SecB [Pediococcus acidilactici]WEE13916.1 protein-export chaperone SecB [Pediococcus acidilactici]
MKNESSFKFTNPKLVSFIFLVNDMFDDDGSANNQLSISSSSSDIEETKSHRKAMVKLTLSNKDKDGEFPAKVPFAIEVSMEAKFKWRKGVYDEDTEKSLLSVNAPSLLLGYIRPIAQLITAQSGYTVNVPFVDFTQES